MADYDIVQIEDDPNCFKYVEKRANEAGLTYVNFSALDELIAALPETSARFWVTDGRFPKTKGDIIENNAAKSVEAIRGHYPDARIALHSAGSFAQADARDLGIEFMGKDRYTAEALVKAIKTSLGE